jgi:hypothetical protein
MRDSQSSFTAKEQLHQGAVVVCTPNPFPDTSIIPAIVHFSVGTFQNGKSKE